MYSGLYSGVYSSLLIRLTLRVVQDNTDGSSQAQQRDGFACVVMGTPDPDACHIWPFKSNSTIHDCANLQEILLSQRFLLSSELKSKLAQLVAPDNGELAASDRAWNMICFETQLHRWWGKAYFGLKWIGDVKDDGDEYVSYKVEWQWLPRKIHDKLARGFLSRLKGDNCEARSVVDIDTEESLQAVKRAILGCMHGAVEAPKPGARVRDQSGRRVESGRVLSLRVQKEDLDKTKTIIEVQWKLLQVAALSGAGEAPEELDPTHQPPPNLLRVPLMLPREDTEAEEEPVEEEEEEPALD